MYIRMYTMYVRTYEVIGFICRDHDDILSLLSNSNIKSLLILLILLMKTYGLKHSIPKT